MFFNFILQPVSRGQSCAEEILQLVAPRSHQGRAELQNNHNEPMQPENFGSDPGIELGKRKANAAGMLQWFKI